MTVHGPHRPPREGRMVWPVFLRYEDLVLRPIRWPDRSDWADLLDRNREWLRPWEPTLPGVPGSVLERDGVGRLGFFRKLTANRREVRACHSVPLVIEYQGGLIGTIVLGTIHWGSARNATIGYWVDRQMAGRGIASCSVAMLADHAFATMGLHRVELAIRPENVASLRVAEKVGATREGRRERFLHIDGEWRDHDIHVLYAQERPDFVMRTWRKASNLRSRLD